MEEREPDLGTRVPVPGDNDGDWDDVVDGVDTPVNGVDAEKFERGVANAGVVVEGNGVDEDKVREGDWKKEENENGCDCDCGCGCCGCWDCCRGICAVGETVVMVGKIVVDVGDGVGVDAVDFGDSEVRDDIWSVIGESDSRLAKLKIENVEVSISGIDAATPVDSSGMDPRDAFNRSMEGLCSRSEAKFWGMLFWFQWSKVSESLSETESSCPKSVPTSDANPNSEKSETDSNSDFVTSTWLTSHVAIKTFSG